MMRAAATTATSSAPSLRHAPRKSIGSRRRRNRDPLQWPRMVSRAVSRPVAASALILLSPPVTDAEAAGFRSQHTIGTLVLWVSLRCTLEDAHLVQTGCRHGRGHQLLGKLACYRLKFHVLVYSTICTCRLASFRELFHFYLSGVVVA
jgi:hypothetical protein